MRKDQRDVEGAPRGVGEGEQGEPAPGGDPHPQKGAIRGKAAAAPLPFSQAGGDTRVPSLPPPPIWADAGPGAGTARWMGAPQHDAGEQAGLTGRSLPRRVGYPERGKAGGSSRTRPPRTEVQDGGCQPGPQGRP